MKNMANMNLVTGYIGSNHVTAADAGSFHAAIFGDGQYLLNRGQKFSAIVVTNNQLRIGDGDLVMQGRHVRINEGDYVDLTIENGATDYNRNDLVVARYTKDASSGVEAVNLVVIKGNAVTGTAEDPAYTIGDIMNDGAVLNDMPLYRITINGLNVAEVTLLAEEAPNLQDVTKSIDDVKKEMPGESNLLPIASGGTGAKTAAAARTALGITPANIGAVVMKTATASLSASGWSSNQQTVSVSGVTASNTVIVTAAPASYEHYNECAVRCSAQGAGTLTFTCTDKPTSALTANVLILE